MKIGLLSDTHGWLDPKVFDHFAQCDEVWHAGDIGDPELLAELDRFKGFRAVYGNIDDRIVRQKYPEFQSFQCEQLHIWLMHITGYPPLYTLQIRTKLSQTQPDVLVGGHSHILRVMYDVKRPPLLYLNPGAAGRHGAHYMRTLLRFEINDKKIHHIEVIELGRRAILID
ncbi:MAG: metallophosphatase family protein [Candidatus Cardinium sp.]|uniref:metallophosphoesterase family protein n=1 Tax=Cardinium endosymbiont of Dermatophagoides farinae TaxID=2597823 RepID=UPI001182E325|nr:metallophosphoesterase family protein [Cardinium endosymbiont of Dermatophagoides farinae]TSJ81490.1 metallophosphoesterase family protein [Cardinium endosymbiont of Dermatophagoides farinae]UWW97520.1 MAG: metallophosphatase family protein [Candidatus Cardinium sp.]